MSELVNDAKRYADYLNALAALAAAQATFSALPGGGGGAAVALAPLWALEADLASLAPQVFTKVAPHRWWKGFLVITWGRSGTSGAGAGTLAGGITAQDQTGSVLNINSVTNATPWATPNGARTVGFTTAAISGMFDGTLAPVLTLTTAFAAPCIARIELHGFPLVET